MTSLPLRLIAAAARILGPGLLLSVCSLAEAQVPIEGRPTEPQVQSQADAAIVLMFDPRQEDSLALVGSIAAHLAGVPVRLLQEPRARTELLTWLEAGRGRTRAARALGLFAVDVSRREGWRLFFLEPDGVPTLIRRLKPTPDHAPLDEAGVTVHLLVEGLLDGKHVEVLEPVLREEPTEGGDTTPTLPSPRPEPRQSGAPPARSAAAPPTEEGASEAKPVAKDSREAAGRGFFPAVLVGLSTTKWLSGQGWQSSVLLGGAVYFERWSASLDYLLAPQHQYQSAGAAIVLSRHPVAGRISYRSSRGFAPVFSVGAWVDAISRDTVETNAGYRGTPSTIEPSWGFSGSLGVSSPRLSILSVRLDLGLDLAARSVSYVVQNETAKTVLTTSPARPTLGVLLDFAL
jgi:hypothetical protein